VSSGSPSPAIARVADWSDEKQLVAGDDAPAGALLLGEYPVAFAETTADEDARGPWLLLEAILSSPAMFDRVSALDLKLTKWPLSADDETTLDRLAHTYKRNPKKLAQLYHRVAANNVRYTQDGVTGYGIWPTVSRSNHSCEPNARLCATPRAPLVELLLATRPIARGEAIAWNYFSDEAFLQLDWRGRNRQLYRDFQFLCRCARCERERPAGVAALSKADLAALLSQPTTA
jgi:hypothetical protein